MKRERKCFAIIAYFFLFCLLLGLSFGFINRTTTASFDCDIYEAALANFVSVDELELADSYEIIDVSSEITEYAADGNIIEYSNKYGDFSFNATKKGKVKKYSDSSLEKGYLIKGSATFKKCDISFKGSFYVDETGRVMFYKGKMELPKEDTYDGTFYINEHSNSYKKGTYTWKNGDSYKGMFSTCVVLDSAGLESQKSCLDSGDSKSYYYFGGTNEFLYIKFVEGKPTGKGTYSKDGVKYTVKYDADGKCISTKKK